MAGHESTSTTHEGEGLTAARPILVPAAFGTVYLVWGSTYLAIRFAIESLPPFLMAGVRFVIAGVLLYAFMRLRGVARPTLANWGAATIAGTLMLVGGNGLVCWGEQYVASGLAAMLIATVPLWMVSFNWLLYGGDRPTPRMVVGLVLGLFGVATLIGPTNFGGEPIHLLGGLALLSACVFWSLGSLYGRRAALPKSPFLSTAMQMIAGGAMLFLLGTLVGEWQVFTVDAVTVKSLLALAYLIFFGAILALTCYTWLMRVATPAKVATYAYVNPVVALMLGAVFADEALSPRVLVAGAVILGAVVLITTSRRTPEPKPVNDGSRLEISRHPEAVAVPGANGRSHRESPGGPVTCLEGCAAEE